MAIKKTFVTIFTPTEDVHLIKDVGQIPYFMYKTQGYESTIVTYRNAPEYPNLNSEVEGLKVKFLKRSGTLLGIEIAILKYLWASACNIDVLHLFHIKRENVSYLYLYKYLNPKGKVYVKIDINLPLFKEHRTWFTSKLPGKKHFLKTLLKKHFRLTDLFSVETNAAMDFVPTVFPELKEKLIYIPNGANDIFINKAIRTKPFSEKENIIITVGRIGTEVKNTELLLETLSKTTLHDWNIYIIGPIEKSFESYISNYFEQHPELKSKIIFTGNVSNRLELYEWYNRAKIFCLTSHSESGPMVFPEALFFGNYIITTPVGAADDITDNGKYGTIVAPRSSSDLSDAIHTTINPSALTSALQEEIRCFASETFSWSAIVQNLSRHLDEC